MKTLLTLSKIVALSLIMLLSFSENVASQNSATINGKIVHRPKPPLDYMYGNGLVYAIRVDTISYITTIDDNYAGLDYFGQLFVLNDSVEAVGELLLKYDFNGEAYYEIELESIKKLASAPGHITVKGMIVMHGNSATSYPPLPGAVWCLQHKVIEAGQYIYPEYFYYLHNNYGEIWDYVLIINGHTFNWGDSVTVTGFPIVCYDIYNDPYYILKIDETGEILSNNDNENFDNIVTISPNPCKDFITINSKYHKIKNIDIYDIYGKIVLSKKDINHNSLKINNIKEKGILFVRVLLNNKQVVTRKIMIL